MEKNMENKMEALGPLKGCIGISHLQQWRITMETGAV